MDRQLPQSGFSDVDRDTAPQELIRQLDLRQDVSFHRMYRERAIALLGLEGGDRVLDVGCGTGEDVCLLAEVVGPGGWAIGVDSSTTMIAEAGARHAHRALPVTFDVGEAERLSYVNDSFDGCMAIRTFQHIAGPQQALSEMVRVTRPGGHLVTVDPDHDTAVLDVRDRHLARKFLNFRADTIRNGGIAHHMPALFREVGLVDISVVPMTEVRNDYSTVELTSHYEGGIGIAAERGVLSTGEAQRLIEAMRAEADAGTFFTAMTYFLTVGRKAR